MHFFSVPYYLTYNTPSVISRHRLLVAVLLSKIWLLPAARMVVLSYKFCFITEVIRYLFPNGVSIIMRERKTAGEMHGDGKSIGRRPATL